MVARRRRANREDAPAHSESAHLAEDSKPQRGAITRIREWTDPLIFAYLLAMFIRTFVVELFKIPSGSMTPTLVGDVAAEIDYDCDGDDDLIIGRENPIHPYQIFLRDDEGYAPWPTPEVASLGLDVAREFREKARRREDRICVNKFAYWFTKPDRGDIIVFKVPQVVWQRAKPIYVKRLVGLPGENVSIAGGRLRVDGENVTQPDFFATRHYENECGTGFGAVRFIERDLAENEYFFFGDNTLSSSDSRVWGPAPGENLKGKAFLRYLPLSKISFLH